MFIYYAIKIICAGDLYINGSMDYKNKFKIDEEAVSQMDEFMHTNGMNHINKSLCKL